MLFIAEVMRFKNFMLMRNYVNFDEIGFWVDLPAEIINYFWYIPEEFRSLHNAKKMRRKRRQSLHSKRSRTSFSLAPLNFRRMSSLDRNRSASQSNKAQSAPAVIKEEDTKFDFDNRTIKESQHQINEITPELKAISVESKVRKRKKWMEQRKKMKSKKAKKSQKKKHENAQNNANDDEDEGIMSDIEDNDNSNCDNADDRASDSKSINGDEHEKSVSILVNNRGKYLDTPTFVGHSPDFLVKTDDETNEMPQFSLNELSINTSDDQTQTEAQNQTTTMTKVRDFELSDFFDGYSEKEIDKIIISPIEDALRIRDRYILNGAELQINLSGFTQQLTLRYFDNDSFAIDWKAKMNQKYDKKQIKSLSLMNLPTKSEKDESTQSVVIDKEKMRNVIVRFDAACEDILKELLLHEFDRWKSTNEYLAYFKSTLSSQKRLGSIYKKIRRKTSRVLPSNNHSSPKLTALNQLSTMHKSHSLPRKKLKLNKTMSANDGLYKSQSLKAKHVAISASNSHIDVSPTNASIASYSGQSVFSVLNSSSRPQSARLRSKNVPKFDQNVVTVTNTCSINDILTTPSPVSPTQSTVNNNNKLTLILEHSGCTNPITPKDDETPIDVKKEEVEEESAFVYTNYIREEIVDSDNNNGDLQKIYDDVMKEEDDDTICVNDNVMSELAI